MRVLPPTFASNNEGAWLQNALRESAHRLQRGENLLDGSLHASQEQFDAIIGVGLGHARCRTMLFLQNVFTRASNSSILVVVGKTTPAGQASLLHAGADAWT